MEHIDLVEVRIADELSPLLTKLKTLIEDRINLSEYSGGVKPVSLSNNLLQRISLMAGVSLGSARDLAKVNSIKLSNNHFHDTVFTRNHLRPLWTGLLKLRYQPGQVDWKSTAQKSKVINYEMLLGANHLLDGNRLEEWLMYSPQPGNAASFRQIPALNLSIGSYEDDIPAYLGLNGKNVTNTQILIAGTTGSGKSNLLAVLIQQLRSASVETAYPVNFLLFDYKGEFSDPDNAHWLGLFETDARCLYNPVQAPLPFTPFKNFEGKTQNEINLYATELSTALCALDDARISANMADRLAQAVINAYKFTFNRPVTFELILRMYASLQPGRKAEETDSVKSLLNQLIRSNLFAAEDQLELVKNSLIIRMDGFPKDGVLAKAIVYFTISKLNTLYEHLPKQAVNEEVVELRHFTIIDEAHYMLGFDNKPLRNLIAVGRNKGLSIILATQNMESFKSDHFDFYANAQYPLIMRQQTINDKVIKDLFGVSGAEFQEIKEVIGSLQKGELILKNQSSSVLGIGKKYKKIRTSHLI